MGLIRKQYTGRLTRTLSQIENWCKKLFQDEASREWLYEHTGEEEYVAIYEAILMLSALRDGLVAWVRVED